MIVKIHKTNKGLKQILKEAIKESGLSKKAKIFIKPNISHPEYIPGVVSDPELLSKLVGLLRDNNAEVLVGESNGYNYSCKLAFEKTGLKEAVQKAGGSVVNLSDDKLVKINFQNSINPPSKLFLPKSVLEADAIVDLAQMKTHEFTTFSGAIKNLFGCIPSNRRIYLHPFLNEVFNKLYSILNPNLTIMDARVGLEGNGPTKGDPVNMDLILTSNSALATDIIASEIMGLRIEQVSHLNYISNNRRLLRKRIKTQGLEVKEVVRKFKLPRIDLPVRAQMQIYRYEFLTKILFCSLDIVKIFQKITLAYRGKQIEIN
jgi:uncharacterized protein (DUF362 family)